MKQEFIEGVHYYLYEGKVIMTELFLKEKGSCCGNKCTNCPYSPKWTKGVKELLIKQ